MSLALHILSVRIDLLCVHYCWLDRDRYLVGRPRHHGPVRCACPMPARRPQARACRFDRARWKRRRFVQRLRRST